MFFLNLIVGSLALGLVRGSVLQGSSVQTGCEGSLLMHSEEGEVYTLNMTTLQQDEKGMHQLKGGSLNVKHALRHGTCCYRLSSGRRRYKEVKMEGEHIIRMKIRKVELISCELKANILYHSLISAAVIIKVLSVVVFIIYRRRSKRAGEAPGAGSSTVGAAGDGSSTVRAPGAGSSTVGAPGAGSSTVEAPGAGYSTVGVPGEDSTVVGAPISVGSPIRGELCDVIFPRESLIPQLDGSDPSPKSNSNPIFHGSNKSTTEPNLAHSSSSYSMFGYCSSDKCKLCPNRTRAKVGDFYACFVSTDSSTKGCDLVHAHSRTNLCLIDSENIYKS